MRGDAAVHIFDSSASLLRKDRSKSPVLRCQWAAERHVRGCGYYRAPSKRKNRHNKTRYPGRLATESYYGDSRVMRLEGSSQVDKLLANAHPNGSPSCA